MKNEDEVIKSPAWKHAFEILKAEGLTYGTSVPAARLSELLREPLDSANFQFSAIQLKQLIEVELGLYFGQAEGGREWRVLTADAHEDQAQTFDKKVRRYAVRSVNLRSATLMNPAADLTPEVRAQMETNLERAATRLVLIARSQSAANVLKGTKAGQKVLRHH